MTFTGNVEPTRNYNKHCNLKIGKITGQALRVSSSPYAIVDIDINHEFNDEEKEEVRQYFETIIKNYNLKVVKTGSGGYHFYSLWDNSFKPSKDSYTKVFNYSEDEKTFFDVDLFVPYPQENKNSRCVLLPKSEAKNKEGKMGIYEMVKDCKDENLISFNELKEALFNDVGIEFSINSQSEQTDDKTTNENIDDLLNDDSLNDILDLMNEEEEKQNINKKLFDVIVKGFDKSITIHNDCGAKLTDEVSIFPIISALNACVNDEITTKDVDEALDFIYENATLTDKAKSKWFEQIHRNKNAKSKHYGGLFTILKTYNTNYYKECVLPLLKNKTSTPDDFLNERYTISDYKKEKGGFETFEDYIYNLVKCLAFIDNGKYIIKEKDNEKIKYSVIDGTKLNEILNFDGSYTTTYEITEEDVEKARKAHKKLPKAGDKIKVSHKIKMMKMLRQNEVQKYFKRFESTSLIGDDKTKFGLYRPPNPANYYTEINEDKELVDKFLNLINDQLYDDNAKLSFNHFLLTHAYLLQHNKKSNVFFVKYSTTGNTGKNYIDNSFSKLYEGFTLNGVTENQMNEKHNGGMSGKLYRAYDEFDNSNYQNKTINNVVKRLTNDKMAVRSMNTDTKEEYDFAIDVLNTNDPAIYGLLKGGKALMSRLCIIRLKERDIKESQFADDMDVIDDKNFAYSLYKYLMNVDLSEFVRDKCFNRYPLDKTEIIVKQLTALKSSTLDEFIESIYKCFEQKKYKGETVDVISSARLHQEYEYYMKNRKYRLSTSFDDELESKGIHKIKSMRMYGQVLAVYYRLHIEPKNIEYECFDDDTDDEFEPVKESI